MFLKQSTQTDIVIGPVWATADGALKSDLAYNASGINCDIYKGGTKSDITLTNSSGNGYFRAGSGEAQYILTLSTTDTNTVGRVRITLSATGYYCKPVDYFVLPANVYDSLVGSDYLKTEVVEISGDSAAADNLEADYDGTGYAKTASTTKLHADYDAAKTAASQSSVNTIAGYLDTEVAAILAAVDTEVAAIKAKTDNLPASPAAVGSQMDLVNAPNATAVTAIQSGLATAAALDAVDNFVDTEVAAIKAVTDKLDTAMELDNTVYRFTANALEQASGTGATAQQVWEYTTRTLTSAGSGGATLEEIEGSTVLAKEATLTTIDGVVDAIKTKTDQLNFTGTDVKATLDSEKVTVASNEDKTGYSLSTAPPTAAAIADAVWDETVVGVHEINFSAGEAVAKGYLLSNMPANVVTALGTGSTLTAVPWNAAWDAEVQSECTDALNAYDPPTKTEMDAAIAGGDDAVLARLGTPAGASVSADIAAVKAETASILEDTGTTIPAAIDAVPTATENADALLNRDMSAVSDTTARSPLNALRALRNKSGIADGTYTVYKEDDTTSAWTAAVTSEASAEPITEMDPA